MSDLVHCSSRALQHFPEFFGGRVVWVHGGPRFHALYFPASRPRPSYMWCDVSFLLYYSVSRAVSRAGGLSGDLRYKDYFAGCGIHPAVLPGRESPPTKHVTFKSLLLRYVTLLKGSRERSSITFTNNDLLFTQCHLVLNCKKSLYVPRSRRPRSSGRNSKTNMLGAIRSRSPSEDNHTEVEDSKQSTWLSLPQKTQLGLIFAARLSDFIHLAAIQSYVLDQLKSFDNSLSDSNAAKQLGILNAGFTASQAITSILWGRVSDVPWIGRKPVLMSGLLGTALSCVGLAFSQSFSQALASRIFGGAVNANGGIWYDETLNILEYPLILLKYHHDCRIH
jgi:hypothetical protein